MCDIAELPTAELRSRRRDTVELTRIVQDDHREVTLGHVQDSRYPFKFAQVEAPGLIMPAIQEVGRIQLNDIRATDLTDTRIPEARAITTGFWDSDS
ncbi:hypothetical protein D3C86_1923030 [compost metagenome]